MKKILITGIFLFFAVPAMALNLSPLYKTTAPDNTGDCSGPNFQNNSVTMQAVYVTDSCPAGYYFNVGANAVVDSTTGQVTDTSCQPCSEGHYCPSSTSITVNSNGTLESQGAQECLAGTYADSTRRDIPDSVEDPDYAEIIEEYKSCQSCPVGTYASTTGASECTTCADGSYASGEGNTSCTAAQTGYYALADHSGEVACTGATYASGTGNTSCTNVQSGHYATANHSGEETCPTGYNAVAAASQGDCTKVIECPSECSNLKYTSSCSIDDTRDGENVTFANRTADGSCFETIARNSETGKLECAPGYTEENMYAWLVAHPEVFSANYSYCSPNGENDWNAENCENQESGTITLTLTNAPMNEMHVVVACSETPFDITNPDTLTKSSISDTPGAYAWAKNVDFPDQPWYGIRYFTGTGGQEQCQQVAGYMVPANQDYMFGSMQENGFDLSQDGARFIGVLALLAPVTDGQNGNPTADVCAPSKVNVNWTGVSLPDDDPARTCTYGEHDLTAPSEEQLIAPAQGYKFIGWTVR